MRDARAVNLGSCRPPLAPFEVLPDRYKSCCFMNEKSIEIPQRDGRRVTTQSAKKLPQALRASQAFAGWHRLNIRWRQRWTATPARRPPSAMIRWMLDHRMTAVGAAVPLTASLAVSAQTWQNRPGNLVNRSYTYTPSQRSDASRTPGRWDAAL